MAGSQAAAFRWAQNSVSKIGNGKLLSKHMRAFSHDPVGFLGAPIEKDVFPTAQLITTAVRTCSALGIDALEFLIRIGVVGFRTRAPPSLFYAHIQKLPGTMRRYPDFPTVGGAGFPVFSFDGRLWKNGSDEEREHANWWRNLLQKPYQTMPPHELLKKLNSSLIPVLWAHVAAISHPDKTPPPWTPPGATPTSGTKKKRPRRKKHTRARCNNLPPLWGRRSSAAMFEYV